MKSIGKYQVLEELGSSAAGVTYRARDSFRNREFALKVLHAIPDLDASSRDRFCGDLSNCAELVHRQLVKIHDLGEVDGSIYLAAELLSGMDLQRFMQENRSLPVGQKIAMAAQVAEGLAFAHSREIAHGNLKPTNIFVDAARNAIILDFGIGKWVASVLATGHRLEGLGPNYLAPEQVLGQPFDARSDLFSLALILYEFVAGKYPFDVAPGLIPREIVHGEVEPLRKLDAQIPEALEQLIARALHKDPAQRLQTAEEFAAGLYAVAQEIRRAEAAAAVTHPPVPEPPPPVFQATAFATPPPETAPAGLAETPAAPTASAPIQRDLAPAPAQPPAPVPGDVASSASLSKPAAAGTPSEAAVPPATAPAAPAPKSQNAAAPVQPGAKPRATAPAPAVKPSARPPVKPVPAAKPTKLSKRAITIAAGAILAISLVAAFISRQSLRASQSKSHVAAPVAAQAVQAAKPAGTPNAAPAPVVPAQAAPAPAAAAPQNAAPNPEPLAKRILNGNVRPLWEAGKYAEALGLVDQVLAVDPENAEARVWKKKIREAQAAEAAIK